VLIDEHLPQSRGPRLYHIDLYRIGDAGAAFALGLEEYVHGDGVTVIEWAERARDLLPAEKLWVNLAYLDYAKRSMVFEASSEHYAQILAALRAQLVCPKAPRTA